MIPITEFQYGVNNTKSNPMHERLLLLKMRTEISDDFATGYYDAIHDVFKICCSPFMQTQDYVCDNRQVNNGSYKNYHCVMPTQFMQSMGPRCITHFMPMDEALDLMSKLKLLRYDINNILSYEKYLQPYLVITYNNNVIITETSAFADRGTQFKGVRPSSINGDAYHTSGILPIETIKYVASLEEFHKISQADSANS